MDEFTGKGLGGEIKKRREAKDLTQRDFGLILGYGSSAQTTVSRLESGNKVLDSKMLAKIAEVLGCTVEELERGARARTADPADEAAPVDDAELPSSRELRGRAKLINERIEERKELVEALTERFNVQHERAAEEFFEEFIAVAQRVGGAPVPDGLPAGDGDEVDPSGAAAQTLKVSSREVALKLAGGAGGAAAGAAAGSAAAYGAFVATASIATASTGAAISGLSGVAAVNATLAALGGGSLAAGGAGMAGGVVVLMGIVAAPAAVLAAGGLIFMTKRSRKQREQLARQVIKAEAELESTQKNVDTFDDVLSRATKTLDHVATHAGRRLELWKKHLDNEFGVAPMAWESLGESNQKQYRDFIEIAGAQMAVVTINGPKLLTAVGDELDDLAELVDQVLTQSAERIEALV